ncbi:hypothetical protein AXF42_Ash015038 [Apostasia shenzhenica]|uniref:Uncharacterized protein n=1 Tax=Apostasia shenzhenica TaxID=1088818 RepID=A0A2I0B2Z3_9ASPA|nr:hypothetical protein AXF42_Ash015038 [Apostasia shenzhenica]
MDLQISRCPENNATNLTTIGLFKCVTKARILVKFLDFPPSAHIRQERLRSTAGGAAAGGAAPRKI